MESSGQPYLNQTREMGFPSEWCTARHAWIRVGDEDTRKKLNTLVFQQQSTDACKLSRVGNINTFDSAPRQPMHQGARNNKQPPQCQHTTAGSEQRPSTIAVTTGPKQKCVHEQQTHGGYAKDRHAVGPFTALHLAGPTGVARGWIEALAGSTKPNLICHIRQVLICTFLRCKVFF